MRDPERMADILDFASEQERGVVACAHGTHRSVAAGQVLQLFSTDMWTTAWRLETIVRVVNQLGHPWMNYLTLHVNWHPPQIWLC